MENVPVHRMTYVYLRTLCFGNESGSLKEQSWWLEVSADLERGRGDVRQSDSSVIKHTSLSGSRTVCLSLSLRHHPILGQVTRKHREKHPPPRTQCTATGHKWPSYSKLKETCTLMSKWMSNMEKKRQQQKKKEEQNRTGKSCWDSTRSAGDSMTQWQCERSVTFWMGFRRCNMISSCTSSVVCDLEVRKHNEHG